MSSARRRMALSSPFVAHSHQLVESMAWRGLGRPGRKIINGLEAEHLRHGGQENGNLIVTYDHFEERGCRRRSIPGGLRDTERRGLVRAVRDGRDINTGKRKPTIYRLTYLPWVDETRQMKEPTDEWKRFVEPPKIQKPRSEKAPYQGAKTALGEKNMSKISAKNRGTKTPLKVRGENGPTFYIYGDTQSCDDPDWRSQRKARLQ